jgi:RNA polymerase sigma-70 factor, ECF subfamily
MSPTREQISRDPKVRSRWRQDLALARRCAEEPAAREELFRTHSDAVYRLAYRLLGNPLDAEDVVQETFISVFASLHSFRGEASLRSWLHRITVRTAGHYRRKARRKGTAPLSLVPEELQEGNSEDPGRTADARAALKHLRKVLGKVGEGRRAVFILHEVEGYSLPEAAALLDISVTAAKKRVWRARRDLERLAKGDPVLSSYFSLGGEDNG